MTVFDVVGAPVERLGPSGERHAPRDQALEPVVVGPCQRIGRRPEVAVVGVDRPERDIVLEHDLVVERADVDAECSPARRHARQAHDGAGGGRLDRLDDDLGRPGALDDDVELGGRARAAHRAAGVAGAERGGEPRLRALGQGWRRW